jgi:hypothetical protein
MKMIASALICMLVIASCSGDSTGPVDGGVDLPESFSVSYTAENDRSVDELINAESGGTVEATGSNGVIYRLVIPAGALASDTLVTITPVSDLTVTGPGTFICASSCAEIDCCVTGALFEPDGLEFDSLVTLEIIFPAGEEFPFDSSGSAFLFDSPHTELGPCESEIDFAAKTLTARIWHFTGYGTGATDCARLIYLYEVLSATVSNYAGMDYFFYYLYDLIQVTSANRACDPFGNNCHEMCAGLNALVISSAGAALRSHQNAVLALHPVSPASAYAIDNLIDELGRARHFSHIEGLSYEIQLFTEAILDRIDGMARDLAAQGQSLCSSGDDNDCIDGSNLLDYILSLGKQGIITDSAFLGQVETWLEDCCGFMRLYISADKTEILRAMIDEGTDDMCVCTITLKLTTRSGEPVQGVYISSKWDDGSAITLPGGETDENGEFEFMITFLHLGYHEKLYCYEMVQNAVISEARNPVTDDYVTSDPIMLTFRNFTVTTTVNYSHTGTRNESAETYGETSCSITGGGTNYANPGSACPSACSGIITRVFSESGCMDGICGTKDLIGRAEIPGCQLRPDIDYYIRGDGIRIPVLIGLFSSAGSIAGYVDFETCVEGECSESSAYLSDYIPWPGYGGIPSYYDLTIGGFEPYTWTFLETSEISYSEAELSITVDASY